MMLYTLGNFLPEKNRAQLRRATQLSLSFQPESIYRVWGVPCRPAVHPKEHTMKMFSRHHAPVHRLPDAGRSLRTTSRCRPRQPPRAAGQDVPTDLTQRHRWRSRAKTVRARRVFVQPCWASWLAAEK